MRFLLGCLLAVGGAALGTAAEDPPKAPDVSGDAIRFELVRYRDRIEEDGSASRTVEARVRLRTSAAVADLGQLLIAYVDGLGQVAIEKLAIEKADGRIVDSRTAPVEDINPFGVTGMSIAADVRLKKVTVPGLEPGDLLSYQYTVRLKPLTPGRIFGEMKIEPAMGDPVQSYELDLPRKALVQVRLREGLGAAWEEMAAPPDRVVRRLSLTVVRPGGDKPLDKATIESWTEPDVSFTNFRGWPEVATWWWDLSRGRLDPDATIKTEAATFVPTAGTPREKVAALHRYVSSRIRYLSVSFGIGRMQPRPAPDVLANRYGDCKDKHALLAALAASVGIDVRPVLIHSQRPDLRDDAPGPQQFDHLISVARLGPETADWLWLDTTNALAVPGYLAPGLRDKRALLIERNGDGRLVRTPADPPFVSRTEADLKGAMDAEGKLRAHVVWRFRSDFEVQVRAGLAATPQDRRAEVVKALLAGDWPEGKVSNAVVSDPADVTEPFRIEFDVEGVGGEGHGPSWDLWLPLPAFGLPKPPKTDEAAAEAVELLPTEYRVKAEFEIPEGFTLQPPLSVAMQRPYGSFESTYSVEGRTIALSRTLKVTAKSVAITDMQSYEAFFRAVDRDRDQKFAVLGSVTLTPAASAREFKKQGLAAFRREEYGKAADLLAKATEADAKIKDGFSDLGRALREDGRQQEAIEAFSRQVELEPFHESSYAERAYTLIDMDRWDEAEKDLLKQIEVAPFKAWSYDRLGERRLSQRRFAEAIDYYSRAAAIEPKEAEHWLDLGSAQQQNGQADDARASLQRLRGLDPPDWVRIRAAQVYLRLGDMAAAGELAESALPPLSERLAKLSGEAFGTKDLYWVDRLTEGWHLIGAAALATGDDVKATRYLDAAWKVGFLAEAGWALGTLREKQGRWAEALDLFRMADSLPTAAESLPADRQARREAVARRVPGALSRMNALMDLRTVRLAGPAKKDLSEEVLMLVGPDGWVEKVKGISPRAPQDLKRQISSLGPVRVPFARPEERSFKTVRRGILACSTATGCAYVLDIPGLDQWPGPVKSGGRVFPSFDVAVVKPASGGVVRRDQEQDVMVALHYNVNGLPETKVTLVVKDQTGQSLLVSPALPQPLRGEGMVHLAGRFQPNPKSSRVDVVPEVTIEGALGPASVSAASYTVR